MGTEITKDALIHAPLTEQMAHIRRRLVSYFLERDTFDDGAIAGKCYTSKAGEYLSIQQPNGSWDDVNYYCTESAANGRRWEPYLVLDRMQAMAMAYANPNGEWYHNNAMLQGVENAFTYWASIRDACKEKEDYEGPWSINWWENGNGVQLRFSRIGVVLKDVLSEFATGVILRKLDLNGSTGVGQNALWCTQNALYRALLAEDAEQLKKIIDNNLTINLRRGGLMEEAVQVDNSYHCHGHLLYSNGYGASLFRDMSFWIDTLAGTAFALPQNVIDLMADYMLDGTRWMIRGDMLELQLGYTPRDKHRYAGMYVAPIERMIKNDPTHAAEYQKLLDSIRYDTKNAYHGLSGNKSFWTSALMGHQREGYGVNLRMNHTGMKSSEFRATWPDENHGNLIFWTADATCSVMVDGDEYYSVYKHYDWRHIPGVTMPFEVTDNYWFDNDNNDCVMVSNGRYGAAAYHFNKQNTHGKIGHFFFDEEIIVLGCDISSTHEKPIHTTLNQTKSGDLILVDGKPISEVRDLTTTANWVYNNRIGYVFSNPTTVHIADWDHKKENYPSIWTTGYSQFGEQLNPSEVPSFTDNTFSLWIDHGKTPQSASYAYTILPNVGKDRVVKYCDTSSVTILANTPALQAVYHADLKLAQVLFYEAGELTLENGDVVSADSACALLIDLSGETPVLWQACSNAKPETTVNVQYKTADGVQEIPFTSKPAPYTGESQRYTL